uniref:Uncharacterized protein n=1 Tax=Ditylum brightwellii TaxID=49249 RepID=A0A6U3TZG5_9STRA|mmetsp:Transcript_38518/g.57739  ORF Transcript_38518/g.57739 Transcript_38518/m.57739 type:complete len:430 (+) Transcript_38518:163-1452(+)
MAHPAKRAKLQGDAHDDHDDKSIMLGTSSSSPSSGPNDDSGFATSPLVLQLVIPYLPCGHLRVISQLNHACRHLAWHDYKSRFSDCGSSDDEDGHHHHVTNKKKEAVIRSYAQKTCPLECHPENPWNSDEELLKPRCVNKESSETKNLWTFQWKEFGNLQRQDQEIKLVKPQELIPANTSTITTIAHSSIRGSSILIVAVRTYSTTGETITEDDLDDDGYEDRRKEIWAITYDISSSTTTTAPCQPVILHQISGSPVQPEWFGYYEGFTLGSTSRSGNGNVFATMVAVPDGCEHDNDAPPEISVFEIQSKTSGEWGVVIRKEHILVETFNHVGDYSEVRLSLDTNGDYLSIMNPEKYGDEGGWTIVKTTTGEKVFETKGIALGEGDAYFTPDDELVVANWFDETEDFVDNLRSSLSTSCFARGVIMRGR